MSAAVMDDEQIIRLMIERAKNDGGLPGQNKLCADYGIGKGRVARLLAIVDQRMAADRDRDGRTRTTSKQPGPGRKPSADQTGGTGPGRRVGNSIDRTPADAGPDRSGSGVCRGDSAGPDQDATQPIPVVPDLSGLNVDRTNTTRTGSDRSGPLLDVAGPDRHAATEDRSGVRSGPGSNAIEPGPKVEPDWSAYQRHLPVRSTAQTDRTGIPLEPNNADDQPKTPIHRAWLILLALPAFVAVWGGWVGLGGLAGFGPVALLPGIADDFKVNLAVTLPAGMEVYAVIGLRVWLSHHAGTSSRTRRFAMWSSMAALAIGCFGQVIYHVLARPADAAPLIVTVFVACLPVAVLGAGAALFHLTGEDSRGSSE